MCLQPAADGAKHAVFFRSGPGPESHWEGCEDSWRLSACDHGDDGVRRCHSVLDQGEGLCMVSVEDMK